MRLILALVLACLSHASVAAPSCLPREAGGTGSELVVRADASCMSYGWICGRNVVIVWGRWADYASDWPERALALAKGGLPAVEAEWAKHPPPQRDANGAPLYPAECKGVVDPAWRALVAMVPPEPPVSTWKVLRDPFRADGKRLVYTVVAGKRGAPVSPAQYVDAGTPCDPAVRINEFGGVVFMGVAGGVARCSE